MMSPLDRQQLMMAEFGKAEMSEIVAKVEYLKSEVHKRRSVLDKEVSRLRVEVAGLQEKFGQQAAQEGEEESAGRSLLRGSDMDMAGKYPPSPLPDQPRRSLAGAGGRTS